MKNAIKPTIFDEQARKLRLRRIFAIGDAHGCRRELRILLNYLLNRLKIGANDLVAPLGDAIDRGADSAGTLDELIRFARLHPLTFCIRGDHEDTFEQMLEKGEKWAIRTFLKNGGRATLRSYGLKRFNLRRLRRAVPKRHRQFLKSLHLALLVRGFYLSHAGANSARPLMRQTADDVLWHRTDVDLLHVHGQTLVFGHTPHDSAILHPPYAIAVDSGCVFRGGCLSMVELLSGTVYSIKRGGRRVIVKTAWQTMCGDNGFISREFDRVRTRNRASERHLKATRKKVAHNTGPDLL